MPHLRRLLPLFALSAALCLGGFRCEERPPRSAELAPKTQDPLGPPDLRLWLLTDPKGYLEPCGCQQRPLGGVDKLATIVAGGEGKEVPGALLAAGDLLFGAELHGEDQDGARTQELWKAETLAAIWSRLGMVAAAPGPLDYAEGTEVASGLQAKGGFPWMSATLQGTTPPLPATRVVRVGAHSVGVVASHAPDAAWPAGLTPAPHELQGPIAALRKEGAELIVALHVGDRRSARAVARAGADVVLLGGLDEQDPLPPVQQGDAIILSAGRQGQGVVQLDVALKGEGPLVDVSAWSLEHRRADLEAQATQLAEKIAAWEKDEAVKAQDLATQKARLARLRERATQVARPPHQGRWLSARYVELDPEVPGDPAIAAQLDAYDRRVNTHNREALADRAPEPAPPGKPHYLGSKSCGACHTPAVTWWESTPHGNAYATLEEVHKEFNLSCVGCHVTGYNQPGGSTVTHVENLKDVGCESCHGPGSQHAQNPQEAKLAAAVPERTCVTCHNEQHSARFQYDAFRALLMAPGHGKPVAAPPAGGAR